MPLSSDRPLETARGRAHLMRSHVRAPVMEVFASIQGEGAYIGEPQVFLRLRGCPLRCRWCDTPGSWGLDREATARVATPGGSRREPAWASPFQVACWIAEVEPGMPRTLSVTGGEPLVWAGFLGELKSFVGPRRMHLETAGGHPRALAQVIDDFDHTSLDLKLFMDMDAPVELPTSEGIIDSGDAEDGVSLSPLSPFSEAAPTDEESWRAVRRADLELVRGRDACGKIVVSAGRQANDYAELLLDVARHAPELHVYLQPVTPMAGVEAPPFELLEELCEAGSEMGLTVRVVPQVHRFLRIP